MIRTEARPRRASHPLPMGAPEFGVRAMLLYEILARARMREAEEAARRHRMAWQLVTRRRWYRPARNPSAAPIS